MKLRCKRSTYHYAITWGKVYEVLEARKGEYKIQTGLKSFLWVTLKNRDYEFEVVEE